ncbi:MAG: glycosyl hydrolase [Candidatus Amesbacteria bacterium]|nr:glycosyl hydrolase [Candidatus Amesbacteria bacterium]
MKPKESWQSYAGILILALALPLLLRGINQIQRTWAGAEGRLAAINVQTDQVVGPLPRPWQALAQGGDELTTFMDSTQPQIKALGIRYIRIDHIYDGFNVVSKNGEQLVFNWVELDKIVDKIRSAGATPFLSLSYMPLPISKSDIIDEPKNWNDWSLVIQKTIEHYSGEKNIPNIYYEVWNEPDLFGKWTMGGAKNYQTLYLYASRGATKAKVSQTFKFGGPATTGLYKNWIDNFFPFVLANKLRLDFFSWHRYDLNLEKYSEDVTSVERWIESHPYFSNVEKIVSELGADSEKGGANDTNLGTIHLLAVSRELLYKIKYGFSFSVTGAWGVLGKPREQALRLLSNLGENRLGVTGEGTWVKAIAAKSSKGYQVLVINYDPKRSHSEVVPVTFTGLTDQNFLLRQAIMGSGEVRHAVATTEAVLQYNLPMTPNSAVLLELIPSKIK